tara:strand:- start:378 stop:620 length:243 start_codon:yes stop_codon:yes gene_type:complete
MLERIEVKVQPRAKQEKILKLSKTSYKVYTNKPAIDGKANKAVVKLLANYLGLRKNQVTIVRGEKSRDKIVEIRQVQKGE